MSTQDAKKLITTVASASPNHLPDGIPPPAENKTEDAKPQKAQQGRLWGARLSLNSVLGVTFVSSIGALLLNLSDIFIGSANQTNEILCFVFGAVAILTAASLAALNEIIPLLERIATGIEKNTESTDANIEEVKNLSKVVSTVRQETSQNTESIHGFRHVVAQVANGKVSSSSDTTVMQMTPRHFSDGIGGVTTANAAMRSETSRIEDAQGIYFGQVTDEVPPSVGRIKRSKNNPVVKWTLLQYFPNDTDPTLRDALLNAAAVIATLDASIRSASKNGEILDFDKLEVRAVTAPTPAETIVSLTRDTPDEGRVQELLIYQGNAEQPLLRRIRNGKDFINFTDTLNQHREKSLVISLRALRLWLGCACPDENGFLSKVNLERRLSSPSPSVTELLRLRTISHCTVTEGDHMSAF